MRIVLYIFIILVINSCNYKENRKNNFIIAKVGDSRLYTEDIKNISIDFANELDSLNYVKTYINTWIKQVLLLEKATQELTDEELTEIEKKVVEYRNALVEFNYKQTITEKKFNDTILEQEILDYYDRNMNMTLNYNLVKVTFLKLNQLAPDIGKVEKWFRSSREKDKAKLEEYSIQYADKFENFNNKWLPFGLVLREIPLTVTRQEIFLKKNKYIKLTDETHYYFLYIKEYRLINSQPPLNYVKEKIKTILKNKKKIDFIDKLTNSIYQEALINNEFIIYDTTEKETL